MTEAFDIWPENLFPGANLGTGRVKDFQAKGWVGIMGLRIPDGLYDDVSHWSIIEHEFDANCLRNDWPLQTFSAPGNDTVPWDIYGHPSGLGNLAMRDYLRKIAPLLQKEAEIGASSGVLYVEHEGFEDFVGTPTPEEVFLVGLRDWSHEFRGSVSEDTIVRFIVAHPDADIHTAILHKIEYGPDMGISEE